MTNTTRCVTQIFIGERKTVRATLEPVVTVEPLAIEITVQSTQGPPGPQGPQGERGLPSEVSVTVEKPAVPDSAVIPHADGSVSTVEFSD